MDTQSKRRNIFLMAALACTVGAKAQSEKADSLATDSLLAAYEDDQRLGEAVVRVRRPAYVQHIDKKVFNASSDVMSASLSASELMQNIPSVQVDVDGNVSLRGDENVKILIDGKPSTLMSVRTRADALRQIPASQIERIEIISNPSAQYKPDGTSGIINIVMKQNGKKRGLSGSITANGGTGQRANGTAALTYNFGRASLSASYGIRRDNKQRSETDERTRGAETTEHTVQQTIRTQQPLTHTLRLGTDWAIDSRNRLQWNGNYSYRGLTKNETFSTSSYDAGGNEIFNRLRTRLDDEYLKQLETGATFTHTFGEGHNLVAAYTFSDQRGLEDNRFETFATDGDSRDNSQIWQAYHQHLLGLTYKRNLGENMKLALGYELDHLVTDLNYHIQNWDGEAFVPDMGKTNDFSNYQTNNALFATLEWRAGRWAALLGLRPELMHIKSHLVNQDSTVTQSYFMLYPSLHTAYTIDGHNELQLNYSLRVNRPEADDMNPFAEYLDPLTVKAGNPMLKPEKIHSIEAGYQWRSGATSILATLYYSYTTNKITSVTRYLDPSGTIMGKTKENMNGGSAAGLELIVNTSLGRWATINLSGNLFSDKINAQRLGYGKDRRATAWNAALNASFNLFSGAVLQLNSRYLSSSLIPQGRRDGTFVTDLGLKYDVPKTRLSLSATLSDVFKTFRKSITLDTPELKQHIERRFDSRILYVGANWSF